MVVIISQVFMLIFMLILLPVVDHFKFIYDDHNSGKEKPKYVDQMYLWIYQSRSF